LLASEHNLVEKSMQKIRATEVRDNDATLSVVSTKIVLRCDPTAVFFEHGNLIIKILVKEKLTNILKRIDIASTDNAKIDTSITVLFRLYSRRVRAVSETLYLQYNKEKLQKDCWLCC
jgi:hypothetical protein